MKIRKPREPTRKNVSDSWMATERFAVLICCNSNRNSLKIPSYRWYRSPFGWKSPHFLLASPFLRPWPCSWWSRTFGSCHQASRWRTMWTASHRTGAFLKFVGLQWWQIGFFRFCVSKVVCIGESGWFQENSQLVVFKIHFFHPDPWGNDPIWLVHIFRRWVGEKPPTRFRWMILVH